MTEAHPAHLTGGASCDDEEVTPDGAGLFLSARAIALG
jgi:hypothetical protein